MPSSFRGADLFGSGPHRFQEGRRGFLVLPDASSSLPTTRNLAYGTFELQIFVRGRLVAASESALWALRDTLVSTQAANQAGDLVDLNGRTWATMVLIRVEWGEHTDRGRRVSLPYEARFQRFGT